jgi:hypothetical protein
MGFTDSHPMLFDCVSQVVAYPAGLFLGKQEIVRGLKARSELTQIVVAGNEHRL